MGRISIVTEIRQREVQVKLTEIMRQMHNLFYLTEKDICKYVSYMHLWNASSFMPLSISMTSPSSTQTFSHHISEGRCLIGQRLNRREIVNGREICHRRGGSGRVERAQRALIGRERQRA